MVVAGEQDDDDSMSPIGHKQRGSAILMSKNEADGRLDMMVSCGVGGAGEETENINPQG